MKILILEPYYTGSHKKWVDQFQYFSSHSIEILSLSGNHWKWRMHGGAITLAKKFNENSRTYDLILCSDMLDLTSFQSLTRSITSNVKFVVYFHENQFMYPLSEADVDMKKNRDQHYAFINYISALAADHCFFNSQFHFFGFFKELKAFLKSFPDHNHMESVDLIHNRSSVLPLGLDLEKFNQFEEIKTYDDIPIILWNHRWEHDKNPDLFFNTLFKLNESGYEFRLVVLGQKYKETPQIFKKAQEKLRDQIIHWGYCNDFNEYAKWLWKADFIPVTSNQDFFGGSIIEAMYCKTIPLLPNRLAYPEHIPAAYHEQLIYKKEDDFLNKLKFQLDHRKSILTINFQNFVGKYDWSQLIHQYDQKLLSIKKAAQGSL